MLLQMVFILGAFILFLHAVCALPCTPIVANPTYLGDLYELDGSPGVPLPSVIPGGTCIVPKTLFLPGGLRLKFVAFPQLYSDAAQYCTDNGMLLLFDVPSAAAEAEITTHSEKACTTFGSDQWWIGFDDKDLEGTINLASGFPHNSSSYSHWDAIAVNTAAHDCVTFAGCGTWNWKFGDCGVMRPFICQEAFPNVCSNYYGPHSVVCLEKVWTLVGCLPEGTLDPFWLPLATITRLTSLTYAALCIEMDTIKKDADSGNSVAQQECFGLSLPAVCPTYYGPHSVDCLKKVWELVSCLPEGYKFPDNLTTSEVTSLSAFNYRDLLDYLAQIKSDSDSGDSTQQLNCFGVDLPNVCPTYYGPHSVACLKKVWELVGCLPEGYKFPDNLTTSEISTLSNLDYQALFDHMNATKTVANAGNTVEQLNCYGMALPFGCTDYVGPHSLACYVSIWDNVGCIPDGFKSPDNLTASEITTLDALNISGVLTDMRNTRESADMGSTVGQLNCFGMTYFSNCSTYYGNLTLDCLNTIWTDIVGCSDRGSGFPQNTAPTELLFLQQLNQRQGKQQIQTVRDLADLPSASQQIKCYGMVIPLGCTFYSPHSDDCLIHFFTNEVFCTANGTHYPSSLNTTYKVSLYSTNLHGVVDTMEIQALDQMKCYGITFPGACSYEPPHSDVCLSALFTSVGCDPKKSVIPPGRNATYQMSPVDKVIEELTKIKQNAESSLTTGIDAELCFGADFFTIGNLTMMVVLEKLNYTDSAKYCKNRTAYLFDRINSASVQALLEAKLHNAEFLFGTTTWWLGLDDTQSEGTFQWANGDPLGNYTNWNPALPTSHPMKDCSIMEADHNWKWNVDDCAASHPFICLEVECGFPPVTVTSCVVPCCEHEDCIAGICQCNPAFYSYNCSWTAGLKATVEENNFSKSYLFFEEKLNWQQASHVCEDTWGTLVVPNTSEKHDFILEKMLEGNLPLLTDAVWMGMNDLEVEGLWKYATGEEVNMFAPFGDPTGGGLIPMYDYNTTSSDGRWHFYYEKADQLLNRADAVSFCAHMGGHLPIIRDADEQNRVAQFLAKHSPSWQASFPVSEPLSHSSAWIGMTRQVGYPLDEMRWDDGVKANMHPDWYIMRGLPPPPPDIAKLFHAWKYPPNPDGVRHVGGATIQEYCVGIGEDGLWFDWDCSARFHVVCELGPVANFERWSKGAKNSIEPNDAWCMEDCGAMRLDMLKHDHTALTEYWNDYMCTSRFSFACEVDLPSQCVTYNPPLNNACIKQISRDVGCDPDALPDNVLKHLSTQTAGSLRSFHREIKERVNEPDSLFLELCFTSGVIPDDSSPIWSIHAASVEPEFHRKRVGRLNVMYILNKVPYHVAESICKSEGAVLPTLKNRTLAEQLVKKIQDSDRVAGISHWWIGLDDRKVKGLYEWSSGEPLDTAVGHYTNWSPTTRGTVKGNNCVAIDVSDDMKWVAENCDTENGFICIEVTIDYPASYGFVHRDECYHFRNDPLNREQDFYAKPIKEALESCEKTNGHLSLGEDDITALFLKNTIIAQHNFTHNHIARYWVSLFDKPSPSRHSPTQRNWKWVDDGIEKPFTLYRPFVRDGFKIENVGSGKSELFSYDERCIYGDHQNHTYGNPFGNFNPHFYARSTSCDYIYSERLSWVWTSSYHLLHLYTGRCLTASFALSDITADGLFPGVRVLPCNLTDPNQQWICQSRNPFHLKLKNKDFSLLYDKVEPWDRAYIAGLHYKDDCNAMWRTLLNSQYLCDENHHPGHNLFLANPKKLKPFVKSTANCTAPDLSQPEFTNTHEMELACSLRGGRLASKADIQQAVADGFVDGCFCGYVGNELIGVNVHRDPVCTWAIGIDPNPAGLFVCSGNKTDAVWCYRGQHGTNKFGEIQYAPWCGVLSVLGSDEFGFEERSCLNPHPFICKKKMNNTCSAPIYPHNSTPLSEDWRVGGDGVIFRCKEGYGFHADPLNFNMTSQCVNISGVNQWIPDPGSFLCLSLPCPDPVPVSDSTMVTSPTIVSPGNFKFSDSVTYTCDEGFALNGRAGVKKVTTICAANQKWKPAISNIKCSLVACGSPPRVIFANAVYDPITHSLTYKCRKGYWISRGVYNVTGIMCNTSGIWSPNPQTLVVCTALFCPSVSPPAHVSSISVSSYRYLAKLVIKCDDGYSLVPDDLEVFCDEFGEWSPPITSGWCQNATCSIPHLVPKYATLVSTLQLKYIYTDTLQYRCDTKGFGIRKGFIIRNPHRLGCLLADSDGVNVVISSKCSPEAAEQTWIWDGHDQIKSVSTRKCLSAVGVGVNLQTCNSKYKIQKWDCTSLEGNDLLIVNTGTSKALRPADGKDSAEINLNIATASSWTASLNHFVSVCDFKRVYINYASMCTRYGEWNLPISEVKCVIQQCPALKAVSGATHKLLGPAPTYGTKATYNCKPGYWLTREVVDVELTCDESGNWMPPIDGFRCAVLVCPSPPPVLYGVSSGLIWKFGSKVTYTCIPGYRFEPAKGPILETECGSDALWDPDPKSKFHCVRITCPDPGVIAHATYFIATGEVAFDSVVEYNCDEGYQFAPGIRSKIFRCTIDGSFIPDPKAYACKRTICTAPGIVRNANMIRTTTGDFESGLNVTYECIDKHWINPTTFSASIMCTHDATWMPPTSSIRCIAIHCRRPQFVSNATMIGYSTLVGSIWEIRCHKGFWIEQSAGIKSAATTCHESTVSWVPSNLTCQIATCAAPTHVENAHVIFTSQVYTYNKVLLYQCNAGYKQVGVQSITGFMTTCLENGTWIPNPSKIKCEKKYCNFRGGYFSHGNLTFGSSNKSMSAVGDVVTLTCDEGYWLMMEKGYKLFDFVCKEDELFHPNPIYLKCTAVECPTPRPRLHATLHAPYTVYKSTITYTCKEGFGSPNLPIPVTRWEINCLASGKWDQNFDIVQCKLIECGSPAQGENAYMESYKFTFSSRVRYHCFKGYWLERDVFHFDITCLANTSWDNPPPKCTVVKCIDPATVTDHATLIGDSYSYLDLVTVHCNDGYWINPGRTKVTIRCLHTGKWDSIHDNFTCKAVLCPMLYWIPHATRNLTNYTQGAVVQYTCDSGYFVSRNRNYINVVCGNKGQWDPQPKFIKCLHKTSFDCDPPHLIKDAQFYVESYSYNSMLNITCSNGFEFNVEADILFAHCALNGSWVPDLSTFECKALECAGPATILHSSYVGSDYAYNSVIQVNCDEPHRIFIDNNGELHKTHHRSTTIKCDADRKWKPSPSELQCIVGECGSLETPATMTNTSSLQNIGFGSEVTFQCLDGKHIAYGVIQASVYCTDSGLWTPDVNSLHCNNITCGFPSLPAHGTLIGSDLIYGSSVVFRCIEGHRMTISDKFITEVELQCNKLGSWDSIDLLSDCQRIVCSDPGNIIQSRREPEIFSNLFAIGSKVTYTCREGSWFSKAQRSKIIECNTEGKWTPGQAVELVPCKDITCWFPPHVPYSIKPTDWHSKTTYRVGESVVYQCQEGRRFSTEPNTGIYYTVDCVKDGTWTELPQNLKCEYISCGIPPSILHASFHIPTNLLVNSNASYTCDDRFSITTAEGDVQFGFNTQCRMSGVWNPDPRSFVCEVAKCKDPPFILHGHRKVGDLSAESFVTYSCQTGYEMSGVTNVTGSDSVNVKCLRNGAWSLNVDALKCNIKSCQHPQPINNASLTYSMVTFRSTARYQCALGYFFDQLYTPRKSEIQVVCGSDAKWIPSVEKEFCAAFDCGKPDQVKHATLVSESYLLGSEARYVCYRGYVIDHGEDGLPSASQPLSTSLSIKCQQTLSWEPKPQDVKCVLIQCIPPPKPPKTYYTGGRHGADGSKQFRFGDVITVTCAHGYLMSTTKLLSIMATCKDDGTWSSNPADVNCIDIVCPEPAKRPFASHDADNFNYLTRVTFTCDRGYFISPGISQFTMQCSYTGDWSPLLDLQCKPVDCGNPGSVVNALRRDVSGNYSAGSSVEYFCSPGFYVAAEQDAVGAWVVGDERRTSVKLICSQSGNWEPRKAELHCSDRTSAITLFELSPDGEVFNPWSYLVVPQDANYFAQSSGRARGRTTSQSPSIENLITACETSEVLAVHDLGHWIHITEDEVSTSHVPKLILETGVECGVMRMFDEERNTYWMPQESPYSPAYYETWKGWTVTISLKTTHIVGSFTLHTSRNFENDVKTFYVHTSTNGGSWRTLGPYQCIESTRRIEYFYDFKPFLARYIKLNITSTAMMRPPVVSRFGIFAATFDCVKPVTHTSDQIAVPVFLTSLLVCFTLMLIHGARIDQRTRWKRYIITVPFAPESPIPSSHVYELSIVTAWRDDRTDLLIKIYGSKGSTSIVWLRHDFKGLLRPGFTDTIAVQSSNIGFPQRIDVITVYKKHMIDIEKSKSGSSLSAFANTVSLFSSSLLRFLPTKSAVFAASIQKSVKNILRSTVSVFRKPKGKHWALAGIFLRHGSTNEKWTAEIGDKRGNLLAEFAKRVFGRHRVGFEHGVPKSFYFTSSSTPWYKSSKSILCDNVRVVCRFLYKQHILAFIFSNRSSFVIRNFLAVEKLLISFATISHCLLTLTFIHGFTDPALYFASKQAPTSTLSTALQRSGSSSAAHMVALTTSCALLILLQFVVRVLAGKWQRNVEDCGSYFQGLNPIRSTVREVVDALKNLCGNFVDHLPERVKQRLVKNNENDLFDEFTDDDTLKDNGLVEYLEDTLQQKPVTAEEMEVVEQAAAKLCDLPGPERLSSTEVVPVSATQLYLNCDVTSTTLDKAEDSKPLQISKSEGKKEKPSGSCFVGDQTGTVAPSSGLKMENNEFDKGFVCKEEFKEFESNDECTDFEQELSSIVEFEKQQTGRGSSSAMHQTKSRSYYDYASSIASRETFREYATKTAASWTESLCKMILTGATPAQWVVSDSLSGDQSFIPKRRHVEALLGAEKRNFNSPMPSAYPCATEKISLPDSQSIMSHIVTHRLTPSKRCASSSSDQILHDGVLLRFLIALLSLVYTTFAFVYLLFSSFSCSSGVCLIFVVMFVTDMLVLVIFVMPLAGWLAVLLETAWMRGRFFHDMLRENAM